ncbi:helix-turn-helix domain-containing protein [Sorangium sp. So ce1014]|uniref:helix-turn-helix domain-containing protein n=1 Tax=Sorangium sp. So ce1014 TaxID=3133326 RepID=UPI003F619E14
MPRNDGYTIGEIAEEAGVSERTIRYWYKRNLFVPPPFAGPGTRYLREHRLQILSIQKLREQGLKLPEIKRKLVTMSPADMEALLVPPPPAVRPPPPEPTYAAERWERVVLVPGLELLVSSAGGPVLRQIAQQIVNHFGGAAPGPHPLQDSSRTSRDLRKFR